MTASEKNHRVFQAQRFRVFIQHLCCLFVFEVDKEQETFAVTGTMTVEIPADVTAEELKEIENVLAISLCKSLGCNSEQIQVTVDPKTGQATFVVKTKNPTLAGEMQNVLLKPKVFANTVNTDISENSKDLLPERIRDDFALQDMKVNFCFFRNHKINNFRTRSLFTRVPIYKNIQ